MKKRVVETDQGIQGQFTVRLFDQMQRRLRDRGLIETKGIINFGITSGSAVEIGPGPGYLGLEWLKKTSGTSLKGVEISEDMIEIARKNAEEYGLSPRVEYRKGRAENIPFGDGLFDAVFANDSLHEWSEPEKVFNEIYRILKKGGRFYINDLKRNTNPVVLWCMKLMVQPAEIRAGLDTSIRAAYTKSEIEQILVSTKLATASVSENLIGLQIKGIK